MSQARLNRELIETHDSRLPHERSFSAGVRVYAACELLLYWTPTNTLNW